MFVIAYSLLSVQKGVRLKPDQPGQWPCTELTEHISMDGVTNATKERGSSNRKKGRNATYFKPSSEISQIIHYKGSQINPCSLELSGYRDC